jgi:site-specific DNA recombinase
MNALIYLRVSTKEQAAKGDSDEGYSIPAQREACLRHCAEKGWNVSDEFVDAGESARSADRPNLKAMLARIAEGDIGAVVVHKIDRLARNIEDHVAIRAGLRKAGSSSYRSRKTSRRARRESSSRASTRSWPSSIRPTSQRR